ADGLVQRKSSWDVWSDNWVAFGGNPDCGIGGSGKFTSSPTAVSRKLDHIDVFARARCTSPRLKCDSLTGECDFPQWDTIQHAYVGATWNGTEWVTGERWRNVTDPGDPIMLSAPSDPGPNDIISVMDAASPSKDRVDLFYLLDSNRAVAWKSFD